VKPSLTAEPSLPASLGLAYNSEFRARIQNKAVLAHTVEAPIAWESLSYASRIERALRARGRTDFDGELFASRALGLT
jgi:hypothetical protein